MDLLLGWSWLSAIKESRRLGFSHLGWHTMRDLQRKPDISKQYRKKELLMQINGDGPDL